MILLPNLGGHNTIYVGQTCKKGKGTMALQLVVNKDFAQGSLEWIRKKAEGSSNMMKKMSAGDTS